jgi:hypothetical protein
VALAGHRHVVVAVEPHLGGASGLRRDQRAGRGDEAACVSLPPNAPPMRRTSTVTSA